MSARATVLLLITLLVPAIPAAEPAGGPLWEPFDLGRMITTWRGLANERVMAPLDMGDMAVLVGPERQLFLDNYLVATAEGVTRQVHPPVRHPDNPVFNRGNNSDMAFAMQVRQFSEAPRFRMWYWSSRRWHKMPNGQEIRFGTSYATSNDGVHWTVPDLGLHKLDGIEDPNVVIPYGLIHGLFHEPDDPDPARRFKALVCVERKNPVVREGYYLHTSPDGIHWTGQLDRPVIPSLRGYNIPQGGLGDTSRFWWDPLRKRYVADSKFVIPGKLRCRGMMFSRDLVHWTRPFPTFLSRDPAAQIYGHTAVAYQGIYIGTRWIYDPRYDPQTHSMHVELDTSRDGHRWTRVGAGQPFMAVNPKRDTWDCSRMKPTALLEVGDEIWIYYSGAPTTRDAANPDFPDSQKVPYSTGLATLKRDRFASITAADQAGRLITRPLTVNARRLHINADVDKGGELRIALLTPDNKPIPGYSFQDCQAVSGDSLDHPIRWAARDQLPPPDRGQVRLAFELRNARLFSFWIE